MSVITVSIYYMHRQYGKDVLREWMEKWDMTTMVVVV